MASIKLAHELIAAALGLPEGIKIISIVTSDSGISKFFLRGPGLDDYYLYDVVLKDDGTWVFHGPGSKVVTFPPKDK